MGLDNYWMVCTEEEKKKFKEVDPEVWIPNDDPRKKARKELALKCQTRAHQILIELNPPLDFSYVYMCRDEEPIANWFRGKNYDGFFSHFTGETLYQKLIEQPKIKEMSDKLQQVTYEQVKNAKYTKEELEDLCIPTKKEFKTFQRMWKRFAEEPDVILRGWW